MSSGKIENSRLNAYKKQCESTGEYVEAQKARKKYEDREDPKPLGPR